MEGRASPHGEIDILAVSSENRRHHIGTLLYEHALANMEVRGIEVVVLTGGDRFHAAARALYESLGFTPFPGVYYFKAV